MASQMLGVLTGSSSAERLLGYAVFRRIRADVLQAKLLFLVCVIVRNNSKNFRQVVE